MLTSYPNQKKIKNNLFKGLVFIHDLCYINDMPNTTTAECEICGAPIANYFQELCGTCKVAEAQAKARFEAEQRVTENKADIRDRWIREHNNEDDLREDQERQERIQRTRRLVRRGFSIC